MERRDFVRLAALGMAPLATAADARAQETGTGVASEATNFAKLRHEVTRQSTTFDLEHKSKTRAVRRGEKVTIAEGRGPGYIAQFWMTFPGWFWQHWNPGSGVNVSILKTLILRIYFDGAEKPAVEAPVGDFFGAGLCRISSFAGRYFGTSSGGFFCKWPIPFRQAFRIEVENLDKSIETEIFCNVLYQQAELPPDLGYFHAQFRTGRNNGPAPVPIAEAHGAGHYAGCVLAMQGYGRGYLSYLEAPEHVYVDTAADTPTIVGTGLEDYFLGGWYFREGPFTGPYHGLILKDVLDASVAMYRVHDADAIRFQERLRFTFLNPWPADRLQPFAYSSVAFLYLATAAGQGQKLPSADDLLCWYRYTSTDHQSIP